MANLDKETIQDLTRLCRIGCTEAEQESLLIDLQKIVGYMESLHAVNTDNVQPCNHVLEEIVNVMREDKIGDADRILSRDRFLANAPIVANASAQIAGLLRIPTVIKQG